MWGKRNLGAQYQHVWGVHASCHGRRAGCTPLASGPLRGSTALFSAPICHNTELFPSCTTAPPNTFNQTPASVADSSCCLSQATPVPDLNLNPKSTVSITTLPFLCYKKKKTTVPPCESKVASASHWDFLHSDELPSLTPSTFRNSCNIQQAVYSTTCFDNQEDLKSKDCELLDLLQASQLLLLHPALSSETTLCNLIAFEDAHIIPRDSQPRTICDWSRPPLKLAWQKKLSPDVMIISCLQAAWCCLLARSLTNFLIRS